MSTTQCWAKIEPSHITGDVGMHTEREDTAVKAQIIQTGDMGLRIPVRKLTSKTSLPIQGSDSQRLFLSSSLFYPLEQLHMDHWIQSCLWPADPEHTPLKEKQKCYQHPATKQYRQVKQQLKTARETLISFIKTFLMSLREQFWWASAHGALQQ